MGIKQRIESLENHRAIKVGPPQIPIYFIGATNGKPNGNIKGPFVITRDGLQPVSKNVTKGGADGKH